jgi:diguanylate cyclase (GGDEF)-like protein
MTKTVKKQLKIFLPALMSLALFGVVVFWFIFPQTNAIIMKNKLKTIYLSDLQQEITKMRRQLIFSGGGILIAAMIVAGYMVLQGIRFEKERSRLERKLKKLASTDPLTGALNRRHFWRMADMEIHRHRRYFREMSVLIMDIDRFKRINETFGHPCGDKILQELVKNCMQNLRKSDVFGRIGGQEFAILLVETRAKAAMEVADRLRHRLAEKQIKINGGTPIQFTVSIGVTHVQREDETLDSIIKRADKALCQAKHGGRNRVEAAV